MFATILIIALVLLEAVAIFFAYRAVSTARTPQGSLAWVVFLVAAPYLGVPMFLFLGHSRFRGYILARRDSEEVVANIRDFAAQHPPSLDIAASGLGAFETLAQMPIVSGNDAELLIDGKQTFDAIFAAMEAAQTTILVQFYIIKDDELGRAFRDVLIAQAKRGVKVRLLYDAVGCAKLSKAYLASLAQGGVRIVNVHELRGPKNRFQLNFRNHRKIVVIDGDVGFIGGLNVGDEYMGRDPKFGNWRDTHTRIVGPVVSQLQLVFVEDWHWATAENLISELNWDAKRAEANRDALIVATGPGDPMETGNLYFCAAINAARERIWIASPYFVPDSDILSSLKLAAMRGVDVRILVPDQIDHTIVWTAAFSYFDEMLAVGAQIWRYDDGFMHQKVLLVDRRITSVGTMNLDNRSSRLNFEATAVFFDERSADHVAAMFETDFARSHRMTRMLADAPRKIKYGAPVARLFAPLL